MTSKFAVLGSPIAQSKSPQLHAAAYGLLGLDFSYERFEVKEDELANFLKLNRGFSGYSLTMPLKQVAYEIADVRDRYSVLTGVSNTLVRIGNQWSAHNTDVLGLRNALRNAISLTKQDVKSIVLIGTGATAKSALVAVSELYSDAKVYIWGRDDSKVESTMSFAERLEVKSEASGDFVNHLESADLTITTVPAGSIDDLWLKISADGDLKPEGYLFDVNYNPWPSTAATCWGNPKVISGSEMLIHQAVGQVRIFCRVKSILLDVSDEEVATVMREAIS